jgi:hypothetical protein
MCGPNSRQAELSAISGITHSLGGIMKRITLLAAASLLALLATVGGANAGGLIGSQDIQDDSIKGKDLRSGLVDRLDQSAEVKANADEIKALKAQIAALTAKPAAGPTGPDWAANPGSTIVSATTVQLTKLAAEGTSVETQDLGIPVLAGDVISFHYDLANGANCIGGSPRMFVYFQGDNTNGAPRANSWDQNISNGVDAACGGAGRNVEFTVPSNGTIGYTGLVYDTPGDAGRVTFSNVTVAGQVLNFS